MRCRRKGIELANREEWSPGAIESGHDIPDRCVGTLTTFAPLERKHFLGDQGAGARSVDDLWVLRVHCKPARLLTPQPKEEAADKRTDPIL